MSYKIPCAYTIETHSLISWIILDGMTNKACLPKTWPREKQEDKNQKANNFYRKR